MKTKTLQIAIAVLALCFSMGIKAQDNNAVEQANNPLANIKSLNLHNYYISSLYGAEDASANQTYIRYAQPIGRVLMRASLPIATSSIGDNYNSGLGDTQIFGAYLFSDPSSSTQFGAGPLLVLPTGKTGLGAKKWQAGLSAVAFFGASKRIQYGGLVTWQMSFAGNGPSDVNMLGFQPMVMWQLGNGLYLRTTPLMSVDLENGGANIPFALGIGKVLPIDKLVFNLFIEPQYSVYNHKFTGSKQQLLTGINMQF